MPANKHKKYQESANHQTRKTEANKSQGNNIIAKKIFQKESRRATQSTILSIFPLRLSPHSMERSTTSKTLNTSEYC